MNKDLQILTALANSDRDFPNFADKYTLDAPLSEQEQQALAKETLQVLAQDPEYASQITFLESSATRSMGIDIAVLVAVTFLLRTHMKISRNETGEWNLLVEHKSADNSALESLLNRLTSIMKF